jgi:PleD family two-component response regulator
VISADAASARPALERLVAGINGTNIRTTAGPVPATVSVGAALWSPGQELEDVISRSGRALYAAKNGGRGKIVVDGEADGAVDQGLRAPEADQLRELDET